MTVWGWNVGLLGLGDFWLCQNFILLQGQTAGLSISEHGFGPGDFLGSARLPGTATNGLGGSQDNIH
jgi:hypothetical protein